ncbi:MAG TPA: dihydrofolate reductase family protein, partial [Citricoccus sp.]
LVDELRVLVFPLLLGTGKRLFADGAVPTGLRLAAHEVSPSGVVMAAYHRAGPVALDEVVVHGWDLTVATGQDNTPTPEALAAVEAFCAAVPDEPADVVPAPCAAGQWRCGGADPRTSRTQS